MRCQGYGLAPQSINTENIKQENLYLCPTGRLDLDPCYLAMGETEQQRQSRYAAFVSRGVRSSELMLIREALQRGQLTGSERFVDEIDRKLGVRVERRGQGRPAKCKK